MPDYSVLGGSLRSSLEFPGLRLSGAPAPSWHLEVIDAPAPAVPTQHLGSDGVRGSFSVEAFRTRAGYRLAYTDTGVYDVVEDGSRVRWYRPPRTSWPWKPEQFYEAVRIDILGRVLAAGLHARGLLCLHASAVRIGNQAIGFLAPKGYGKSTLAYALTRAGARLITDDTLPVELGPPARARAGVHNIRMWQDSASRLATDPEQFALGAFGKFQAGKLPDPLLEYGTTSLAALYLLLPVRSGEDEPAAQRDRLDPIASALAVLEHARLGALLGKAEAARLLAWAGDLSGRVQIQVLRVVRDWDRLPELTDTLIGFHSH